MFLAVSSVPLCPPLDDLPPSGDLGHYSFEYYPTNRGFDSSFHLTSYGYTDYTTHVNYGYYDIHQDLENIGSRLNGLYATKMWSQQVQRIIRNRHDAVQVAGSEKDVAPVNATLFHSQKPKKHYWSPSCLPSLTCRSGLRLLCLQCHS